MVALKQGSVPDVIANKLDHLLILTSGTEQYLITCTNKKYKFLLTTTLTISEKYKNSSLKEISRFASGLERDLPAVENAVASPLSNGFVEGTNSKLKMIKRTMYDRCGKELLAAKLICSSTVNG